MNIQYPTKNIQGTRIRPDVKLKSLTFTFFFKRRKRGLIKNAWNSGLENWIFPAGYWIFQPQYFWSWCGPGKAGVMNHDG